MSNPPPADPPGPDPTAEPYGSSWPVGRSAVPPRGYRRPGTPNDEPTGYGAAGFASPYDPPTGYDPPPGSGPPPGYGYPGPAPDVPRRTNVPLIAVILAIAVLLVGATATATVLAARNATDRARAAAKPITHPTTHPAVPTTAPTAPAEPGLPAIPGLPSGWPNLPGQGTTITVTYQVTGDGPAEILYAEKLGKNPVRIRNVKLPWKITTKMEGTALVLVTAVRVGPEPGTIGCRVTVDGRKVAESTHEGSFVSVTCSKLIIPQ